MTDNTLNILRRIEEEAISDAPLSSVLRKCRVLAARLGLEDFGEWVLNELNGYRGKQRIPEYRIASTSIYGHFLDPYGRQVTNFGIPLTAFPEKLRDLLSTVSLRASVSALEYTYKEQQNDSVLRGIIPHEIAYLARALEGFQCIEAWHIISLATYVNAVEAVRNKALEFILQIQKNFPDSVIVSGDAKTDPTYKEQAASIFFTVVYGNAGNVGSVASSDAALTIQSPGAQTASGGNAKLDRHNHQMKDTPGSNDT